MIEEIDSSLIKFCPKCTIDKPLTEFRKDKNRKLGVRSYCNKCEYELSKLREASWTEEQKQHRREIVNKSKEKNRDKYLEKHRAKDREYKAEHRDEINARRRAAMKDPEKKAKRKAQHDAWREANPDKVKKHRIRRTIANTLGGNTALESYIENLLKDPCNYCGGVSETVDHIVCLSKGGKHEVSNLAPACKSCNSAKLNRKLIIFLAERQSDLAAINI